MGATCKENKMMMMMMMMMIMMVMMMIMMMVMMMTMMMMMTSHCDASVFEHGASAEDRFLTLAFVH